LIVGPDDHRLSSLLSFWQEWPAEPRGRFGVARWASVSRKTARGVVGDTDLTAGAGSVVDERPHLARP
jgi:hypothetical protein